MTKRLDRTLEDIHILQHDDGKSRSCITLRQWRVKASAALMTYFQGEWNGLDAFNYTLLLISFSFRMYAWSSMTEARDQVTALPRPTAANNGTEPYQDEVYVNMFRIGAAFGVSFYINAFSAVLTWMKLFKFLSILPQMSIFMKTLSLSAQHLGVFAVVVFVILVGSASGFCLAFGTDVDGFRNPFQSVVSLALFTVGHFNYDDLVHSQRWLGPVLFWMYIFLVFFVLMSIFIAILAEGYEAAKQQIPATHTTNLWEAVSTVVYKNLLEMKHDAAALVGGSSGSKTQLTAANKVKRSGVHIASVLTAFKHNGVNGNVDDLNSDSDEGETNVYDRPVVLMLY